MKKNKIKKKYTSPFKGKIKKEYGDMTILTAKMIIPVGQFTEVRETIRRVGCFPIDSIYESMREGFMHNTSLICDYKSFLLYLKEE